MGKRIVVVNAGPRIGWNTDILLKEAARGAMEEGAEIVRFDLYRLEKYSGCVSCFGCKKEKFKGTCIYKDGLAPVLEAIKDADGLIIGSPNYLSDFSAAFRALFERLIFQHLTYNKEHPCQNEHMIPVLLILTCNASGDYYANLVENYINVFSRFIGPAKAYICGDTKQIKDYSRTDWEWSLFDSKEKDKRHEEIFPRDCERVFKLGKELAK